MKTICNRTMRLICILVIILALISSLSMQVVNGYISGEYSVITWTNSDNLSAIKSRNLLRLNASSLRYAGSVWSDEAKSKGATIKDGYHMVAADYDFVTTKSFLLGLNKGENALTTYTDPLTVYFKDVGTTPDGKNINAKLHISKIELKKLNKEYTKGHFMYLNTSGGKVHFLSESCFEIVEYLVTFTEGEITGTTYAAMQAEIDSQPTISTQMFQLVDDVDIGCKVLDNKYIERWDFIRGYTGRVYKWNTLKSKLYTNDFEAGKTISLKANTKSDGSAVENFQGDDKWLKAGCLLELNEDGIVKARTVVPRTAGSAAQFSLRNDYPHLPEKTADKGSDESYDDGEELTYTVKQNIGTWQGDIFDTYNSLVIEDALPKEFKYESADIAKGEEDLSDKGTLDFDKDSNTLRFTFNKDYLDNKENYNGEEIVLKIKGSVHLEEDKNEATVENIATVQINDYPKFSSAKNTLNVKRKIEVTPRLTIRKLLPATELTRTGEHGEPSFIFKITGKTSNKTWYKSITFSDEALNELTAEEGSDSIWLKSNPIILPEDEYVIEEVEVSRYMVDKPAEVSLRIGEEDLKAFYESAEKTDTTKYKDILVSFNNTKVRYGLFSHNDIRINTLLNQG